MNNIEHSIEVVGGTFLVVVGVAVERFLTGYPLGKNDPSFRDPVHPTVIVRDWRYVMCYITSLVILVSVVIRFLLGSDAQLRNAYVEHAFGPPQVHSFVRDVVFLMFFGAFLVGAALSKTVSKFMAWLALSSGVGAVWSWIEVLVRPDTPYAWWWLEVNSKQFVVTLSCFLLLWRARSARTTVPYVLGLLTVWYAVIFPIDIAHIIGT